MLQATWTIMPLNAISILPLIIYCDYLLGSELALIIDAQSRGIHIRYRTVFLFLIDPSLQASISLLILNVSLQGLDLRQLF